MVSENLSLVILVALPVQFLLTLYYLVSVWRLHKYIEKRQPALWVSLGRPHLITNNTPPIVAKFLRFLRRKDLSMLDDHELQSRVSVVRKLLVGLCIGLAVLVASTAIFIYSGLGL